MKEIKIGRGTYEVKKGDYILDNGACMMFHAGDNRVLHREKFNIYSYLVIPKSTIKKLDFSSFTKKEETEYGITYIYYYI